MIKPDRWIREWGEKGGVSPYVPEQVNAASYDVRVCDHWICPTRAPEEFTAPHIKLFPGDAAAPGEWLLVRAGTAIDEVAATLRLAEVRPAE